MSYLERLKEAKDATGAKVPGTYLLMLARNPDVRTAEQIRELLNSNRSMCTPQQLSELVNMVSQANPAPAFSQATSEELPSSNSASLVDLNEEKQSSTQSQPLLGQTKANTIDPGRFMEVDAMAKNVKLVEIQTDSSGESIKLSWPANKKFKVYAVASSKDSFAKSLARSAWFRHTAESLLDVQSDHDFFTLFGFSEEDQPGILIGYGRRLREVSRLQVEEFQSEIRMLWSVEDSNAKVVLYKSLPNQSLSNYPSSDRIVAQSIGDGTFVDTAVSPGEDYEYRACVQWEGPTRVITTPGKTVTAGVYAPVPTIEDFSIENSEGLSSVEISYRAPAEPARVRLFQVRGLPQPELLAAQQDSQERDVAILGGDNLPNWLGTEIIAEAKKTGQLVTVKSPMLSGQVESRTYIGVSVLGRRFRVMVVRAIPQVGPINGIELVDRFDYQLMRVATPPGAQYLEVWVAGESAKFDQISKLPPDRQVQLLDEYRRFGGVVFGDNLPGVVGATSLGTETKEIFVRGATNFEGVKHFGPVSSITHRGQIAVRYSRLEQKPADAAQAKGLFSRKPNEAPQTPANVLLGIECQAPNRFGGRLTLQHLAAAEYPLDHTTANAFTFDAVVVVPAEYEEMNIYRDESGRTRLLDRNLRHRLRMITDTKGLVQNYPTFTVDTLPDSYVGYRQNTDTINAELKVVILGSKQSGKTTYVQALLNYLEHQFANLFVAKLLPASDDPWAEKRLKEMETFVTTGTLPLATRTAKPFFENPNYEDPNSPNPLRTLKFEIDNGSKAPLRRLSLVDVAGEDMDQVETMSYYEPSIMEADLIILIADPLQLGPVQVAMAGLPLPPKGTDPHIVLRNLNELISRSQLPRNQNQRFAVVFSKFDGFQTLSQMEASPIAGLIQSGMALTRDPNSFSAKLYNDADGALVQQEVLAIMNRLQLGPFVKLIENTIEPNRRRFFVTSSLGHSSHSTEMDAAGLTSWRISDPLRWAIHNF